MAIFFEVKAKNCFLRIAGCARGALLFFIRLKNSVRSAEKNIGYGFIGAYGQAVRKNENRRRHDASERVRPVSSIRPKKRAR